MVQVFRVARRLIVVLCLLLSATAQDFKKQVIYQIVTDRFFPQPLVSEQRVLNLTFVYRFEMTERLASG